MAEVKKIRSSAETLFALIIWAGLMYWWFAPSIPSAADGSKTVNLTEGDIKTLSPDIRNISFIDQYDPKGESKTKKLLIEVEVNKDILTAGAQDWNSVAIDIHRFSAPLLAHHEPVRINYSFWSTDARPFDWARAWVMRANLPTKWTDLTYLEFFSYVKAVPGNQQATTSLCEFYRKYTSARPGGVIPAFCNAHD